MTLLRLAIAAFVLTGCRNDPPGGADTDGDTDTDGEEADLYRFADGCYSIANADGQHLTANAGGFAFADGAGASFFMKASDLGTYLLFDAEGQYVVAEDGPLLRQAELMSDVLLVDDTYVSGAEWELQLATDDPTRHVFRHRKTGRFLAATGLGDTPVTITLEAAEGCTQHPELTVDASGEITKTTFDDGTLYGIVDTHSHILSNFAFGGGGIFHGAPFHRLGVTHALADCSLYHGEMGRKDFFGYAFDASGADGLDISGILPDLIAGELSVDNHATEGWPEFTEWPDAHRRSTHQMQYYRWLERAWMGGLRLVIQHATTNSAICHMMVGQGYQPTRYSCEDMVAVDRILAETVALERYIDAQAGGPGRGFFRIVRTPAEAREVIADGKMAVVLGIETADLFDCRLTPREGSPVCDEAYVLSQIDKYYALGVRAMFPVHKYDNKFSAGDGDRAFIELGNFFNSGHWSNFVLDCPNAPAVFDQGDVNFGGLNMPRDDYEGPPAHDFSAFPELPLGTAIQFQSQISEPPLVGPYCQKTGLTPLGEFLLREMMARGMIIEIDHLPQRAYLRAFEMLEAADYPAAATHGTNNEGRLYALGGVSKFNFGRCREPGNPGATLASFQERIALINANGGYAAEGFGFDLNGFAGAPGPRFGDGVCPDPQEDPVTYPFTSYGGDVEFTQPFVGNRMIDFNTEGMAHIGMLPELLEDARGDASSDADLEPLFRSAEGYIRMWERAEERAAAGAGR
jgi:microsomal dipeptidase-like Zn-dependent dipeptidase